MTVRETAHREAMRADISTVAERLQEVLGQQIAAYAVGVKDPRSIGKYGRGEVKPKAPVANRLRHLYAVTQILMTRETAETVRAWMVGANPLLEERAPVELLHAAEHEPVKRAAVAESPVPSGYTEVASAAEAFMAAA